MMGFLAACFGCYPAGYLCGSRDADDTGSTFGSDWDYQGSSASSASSPDSYTPMVPRQDHMAPLPNVPVLPEQQAQGKMGGVANYLAVVRR